MYDISKGDMLKTYSCGFCNTQPDQLSHHKSHLETQKHKDKREVFELKLNALHIDKLMQKYGTHNCADILMETETIIYNPINKKMNLVFEDSTTKSDDCQMLSTLSHSHTHETHTHEMKNRITDHYNNGITNKECLRDKIHEIHNHLRNNGVGYGLNALKVFSVLFGLKKIEEHGLIDAVNLQKPECEFSYLLQLANENKEEMLADVILNNVLDSIAASKVRELLLHEIPKHVKGKVFVYLIKEIEIISNIERTCNVLLSGKIYEYFIGRDKSTISELGAYYTDRHIVDYCLNKLKPTLNADGTIPTMIDMFGGSGGFTTGFINYMNSTFPSIVWETELSKVFHFDMNEDVVKSAGLEFFCLTGQIPNMETNLKYKNSFMDEFNGRKYSTILTNPPYGGDKTDVNQKNKKLKEFIKQFLLGDCDEATRIRRQQQLKRIEAQEKQAKHDVEKTKVSISNCSNRVQAFAKKYQLSGTDKESCSLILLMELLEVDGTTVGVLKEGVFFDKTYSNLRKCLVENYNVREVISVPQDQFENTSTKTSIVIFDNTPENTTTEIQFRELVVERVLEDKFAEVMGDIAIIENKGDIIHCRDNLITTVLREDILRNPIFSLNCKDYNKIEINVNEGYELVELGSVCEFKKGKQLSKQHFIDGPYPVIGGGLNPTGFHNAFNMQENSILCSSSGENAGYISRYSTKIWASDCFAILPKNINNDYLYFILCGMQNLLFNIQKGSAQPHVYSKDLEKHIQIPIPKSQEKMQEWVDFISAPYNEKRTKQTQVKELETLVQTRIKEIGENEECELVELGSVCEIKYGTRITKQNNIEGNVPVYGGGDITFYTNTSNRPKNTLIVSRYALSACCVRLVRTDLYLNDSGLSIQSKNSNSQQYINSYLLSNIVQKNIYVNCTSGSIQRNLNMNLFRKLKIPMLKSQEKMKKWIDTISALCTQIETLHAEIQCADALYKQRIQQLSDESMGKK